MKKEVAESWCIALRCGGYKQGSSLLRNRDREYCCLGVLSVELGEDIEPGQTQLSERALKKSGMRSEVGRFTDTNGIQQNLAAYNDEEGYDFHMLADVIEENWERL